jgi:hypothetical protein
MSHPEQHAASSRPEQHAASSRVTTPARHGPEPYHANVALEEKAPHPTAPSVSEQKETSKTFYQTIGYPQYGGKYGTFSIPKGMHVQNITETSSGLQVTFAANAPKPSATSLVWSWINSIISKPSLMEGLESKMSGVPAQSIRNIDYLGAQQHATEASFAVGLLASGESTVVGTYDLTRAVAGLAGAKLPQGPTQPSTWFSAVLGSNRANYPAGYYIGSLVGDILIGYGIGKAASAVGTSVRAAWTANMPEELTQPVSHAGYLLHMARETITGPFEDLLPDFRGSALDQWLYENVPGYAGATGGMAKEIVSFPSIAYNVPILRSEIFEYGLSEGTSILQTFKLEQPAVESFLPKYLAWGASPIIGPMAEKWTPQYESVYKQMPSDYLEGIEKPKAYSLGDLLGSTKGETSPAQLLELPTRMGETILPGLANLPGVLSGEMPGLIGFGLVLGVQRGSAKKSGIRAFSFAELLQEPGMKAGTNPLSVLGVAPSEITKTTTAQATTQSIIQQQTSVQNLVAVAVGQFPRRKDMTEIFTFKTKTMKAVGVGRYPRAYPIATAKQMRKLIGV